MAPVHDASVARVRAPSNDCTVLQHPYLLVVEAVSDERVEQCSTHGRRSLPPAALRAEAGAGRSDPRSGAFGDPGLDPGVGVALAAGYESTRRTGRDSKNSDRANLCTRGAITRRSCMADYDFARFRVTTSHCWPETSCRPNCVPVSNRSRKVPILESISGTDGRPAT